MLRFVAAVLGFLALPALCGEVRADDLLTKEEIIERLQGPPLTRSILTRTIRPAGGDAAAATPATGWLPDLRITFPFDSAELTDEARRRLDVVAEALLDARLAALRFEIAGHTDAVGSPDYNQRLSEARAQAARDYLVERWGVRPEQLIPKGFGQEHLFNADEPAAAENRRVELLSIGG